MNPCRAAPICRSSPAGSERLPGEVCAGQGAQAMASRGRWHGPARGGEWRDFTAFTSWHPGARGSTSMANESHSGAHGSMVNRQRRRRWP